MTTTTIRITVTVTSFDNEKVSGVVSLMDSFTGKDEGIGRWSKTKNQYHIKYCGIDCKPSKYFEYPEIKDKISQCVKTYFDALIGEKSSCLWVFEVEKKA